MSPVRSDRLASGFVLASGNTTILTVPGGFTYLVKTIYGYYGAATASTMRIYVDVAGDAVIVSLITLPSNAGYAWSGWLALDPGAGLRLFNQSAVTVHYYVSGTKLPGYAPEPSYPQVLPTSVDN